MLCLHYRHSQWLQRLTAVIDVNIGRFICLAYTVIHTPISLLFTCNAHIVIAFMITTLIQIIMKAKTELES